VFSGHQATQQFVASPQLGQPFLVYAPSRLVCADLGHAGVQLVIAGKLERHVAVFVRGWETRGVGWVPWLQNGGVEGPTISIGGLVEGHAIRSAVPASRTGGHVALLGFAVGLPWPLGRGRCWAATANHLLAASVLGRSVLHALVFTAGNHIRHPVRRAVAPVRMEWERRGVCGTPVTKSLGKRLRGRALGTPRPGRSDGAHR